MKVCILSALALLSAVTTGVTGITTCDVAAIQSSLKASATTNATMSTAQPGCLDDTGYDIFAITAFPTLAQSKKAQASSDCSRLINVVNGQANVASQCTILVNGTTITYGKLISSFLNGKTGNESDSGSGSVEAPSDSDSGSTKSGSNSGSASASTSGSAPLALSIATYGAIAAIAIALR
ncbi:hypothetical protein PHYPSEUDO_007944 [Phytophthora pseudosyringae]|uniref:Elicitin n=1 Tax=Phytophthora pseudosyringae TaxID=221518 RepID=A0A8T1WAZ6_9STRA|nr:hypothetical protein PHYPSEUDO_007944 [Phytophthora pseudosyringae]